MWYEIWTTVSLALCKGQSIFRTVYGAEHSGKANCRDVGMRRNVQTQLGFMSKCSDLVVEGQPFGNQASFTCLVVSL